MEDREHDILALALGGTIFLDKPKKSYIMI